MSSTTPHLLDGRPFLAPGPGPWELERFHFQRPLTPVAAALQTREFRRGFAEGTAGYGVLLSHFEFASVQGFVYMQPVIVGAPPGAMGPPPAPVLWALTRLHPALRARLAVAEEAFERKRWRDDLHRWETVDRPANVAAHGALAAVAAAGLDDEGLARHLEAVFEAFAGAYRVRHRYTASSAAPVGDFMAHVVEWTGASLLEVLDALRGSSPASRGLDHALRERVASLLRDDDAALEALDGAEPAAAVFARLAAREDALGEAFRAWHDELSARCTGYEVVDPSCGEQPELVRSALLASVYEGPVEGASSRAAARSPRDAVAALRERVPAEHRARFDELLAEALLLYRLRDERGAYAEGRFVGLYRSVGLEAGRRLVARGLLDDAELALEASVEEVAELLRSGRGVGAEELRARRRYRTRYTVADAPPWLNGPPAGPPPSGLLPPHARRCARAFDAYIAAIFSASAAPAPAGSEELVGLAASRGSYEGTARVLDGPHELHRLRRGDVLVARSTSAYFNAALPLVGAIVTDLGGQLSHAAIVAREFGIPAVVATGNATSVLRDGVRVQVLGDAGRVRVLA